MSAFAERYDSTVIGRFEVLKEPFKDHNPIFAVVSPTMDLQGLLDAIHKQNAGVVLADISLFGDEPEGNVPMLGQIVQLAGIPVIAISNTDGITTRMVEEAGANLITVTNFEYDLDTALTNLRAA